VSDFHILCVKALNIQSRT